MVYLPRLVAGGTDLMQNRWYLHEMLRTSCVTSVTRIQEVLYTLFFSAINCNSIRIFIDPGGQSATIVSSRRKEGNTKKAADRGGSRRTKKGRDEIHQRDLQRLDRLALGCGSQERGPAVIAEPRSSEEKMRILFVGSVAFVLFACASTDPVNIGGDTYYASATNTAGIFGDVTAVAGSLMQKGNQFCVSQGRQFELVTQSWSQNVPGVRFGGASIIFRCVTHARNP